MTPDGRPRVETSGGRLPAPADSLRVFEVALHYHSRPCDPPTQILTPANVYSMIGPYLGSLPAEEMWAIYLDGQRRVLGTRMISRGTLTSSSAHPREVYSAALWVCADALILAHNHPSRDATPSVDDRAVTRRLRKVGEMHGIQLLDHIVVSRTGYRSMMDEGLLNNWADR